MSTLKSPREVTRDPVLGHRKPGQRTFTPRAAVLVLITAVLLLLASGAQPTPARAELLFVTEPNGITYSLERLNLNVGAWAVGFDPAIGGTDVVIPPSIEVEGVVYRVNRIRVSSFYAKGLTSVQIPDTVDAIDMFAFYQINLSSVRIPASVGYIEHSAFGMMPNLSVIFEGNAPFFALDITYLGPGSKFYFYPWASGFTTPMWDGRPSEMIPVEYVVDFDTGGGSPVAPTSIAWGNVLAEPAAPSRNGYAFSGWLYDSQTPAPYDFSAAVVNDFTLTATWIALEYPITYDLAGGTAGSPENPASYTPDSGEIVLASPAREGHSFVGWIGTALTSPTREVVIPSGSIGERAYAAVWSPEPVLPTDAPELLPRQAPALLAATGGSQMPMLPVMITFLLLGIGAISLSLRAGVHRHHH